jgi:hypothetical protein
MVEQSLFEHPHFQLARVTFLNCGSSETAFGGAIFVQVGLGAGANEFESVCARQCQCGGSGSFVDFFGPANSTFTQVSCVSCDNSGIGTIECAKVSYASFTNINITGCDADDGGSAIHSSDRSVIGKNTTGWLAMSYITCLLNTGPTVIDQERDGENQSISYTNFYNNIASLAVGYGRWVYGITFRSCIFCDNQGPDLGIATGAGKHKIGDCVFDKALPDSSVAETQGVNFTSSVTASHFMNLLDTFYCPTASPTQSPTASRSNTPSPTETVSRTPSPTASITDKPRPTASISTTPLPIASISTTPSPTRSVSSTPSPTASITDTLANLDFGFSAVLSFVF